MMNWFNEVKLFYTSTIILMSIFIWSIILGITFNQEISFRLFFVIIIMSNISRYLLRQGIDSKISLILALVPITIIEFLLSSEPFLAIINIGFSSYVLLKLFKEEKDDINYEEYRRRFLKGMYCIFSLSIFYGMIRSSSFNQYILKVYIGILAYAILAVITLRETMGYQCQIKRTQNSKFINYGVALFGILLTQEAVYRRLLWITTKVKNVIDYISLMMVDIFLEIIQYPIALIFSLLDKFTGHIDNKRVLEFLEGMKGVDANHGEEVIQRGGNFNPFILAVFKGLVLIISIYAIYRFANRIYYKANKNKWQDYTEVIEEIKEEKTKEGSIAMKFKKFFRKKGNPKEEILYKYGEMLDSAAKKEIFKRYMTPNQLKYVIKVKLTSSSNIDAITDIYNEAKFSNHEIEMSQQKIVEENVSILKKELKSY